MNLLPSKIGKNDKFDRTARFTFPGSELESLKHINTLVQENLLKDSKNFKSPQWTRRGKNDEILKSFISDPVASVDL